MNIYRLIIRLAELNRGDLALRGVDLTWFKLLELHQNASLPKFTRPDFSSSLSSQGVGWIIWYSEDFDNNVDSIIQDVQKLIQSKQE